MKVWVLGAGEPLPIDADFRAFRYGMLTRMLRSRGHEVVWWTSTFYHQRKQQRFAESKTISLEPGFRLELLHAPPYESNLSLRRVMNNRITAAAFERQASKLPPPDILICSIPTLELAEKAVEYGRAEGVPVVIDVKDWWPDVFLTVLPTPLRPLGKVALMTEFRRVRRIFAKATGITAISDASLEWALGHARRAKGSQDGVYPLGFPALTTLLPEERAAERKRFTEQHGVRFDKTLVVYIGNFGAVYDLETVIKSAGEFQDSGQDDVQFVLCGDGPKSERLRELALGLRNVVFTGRITQLAICALLEAAHVGLIPVKNHAFPNKLFEYCWGGLPILSSDIGELAELVRRERIGETFAVGDTASFSRGLRQILSDAPTRTAMGERSAELLRRRFATETVYPQFIEHLQRTVHTGVTRVPLSLTRQHAGAFK